MEMEEAVEVVENLNDIYNPDFTKETYFTLSTDGYCIIIKFCGLILWDSWADERVFSEECDEYEDLKYFIIKQARSKLKTIYVDTLKLER